MPKPTSMRPMLPAMPNTVIKRRFLYRKRFRIADFWEKLIRFQITGMSSRKTLLPSCGAGGIYDGSFTKTLAPGDGIFARLLREAGLEIFTEESLPWERLEAELEADLETELGAELAPGLASACGAHAAPAGVRN